MKGYARYIALAKKLGAKDAKVIPAKSIVAAEWVRMKCRFGCGGYGGCLTCPPDSPAPDETRRMLGFYTKALLVQGGGHIRIRELVVRLEREIFLDGYFKAFGMGAGPCELCRTCAKTCRHPYDTRPSLEACGIDVFTTVRANGFPINVLRDTGCKGHYYGIVLIE